MKRRDRWKGTWDIWKRKEQDVLPGGRYILSGLAISRSGGAGAPWSQLLEYLANRLSSRHQIYQDPLSEFYALPLFRMPDPSATAFLGV